MVISFLYEAGFKAEARASLAAELARVEAIIDERIKDGGIYRFIHNQVEMGDYDGALRQAERYTGKKSSHRQSLLGIIARWRSTLADRFAPREVTERALELAREITDPYPRTRAFAELAPALARAGDVEGALRLARDIGKDANGPFQEYARAEIPAAMAEIARAQAAAKDLDGARKTLREALALARTANKLGSGVLEQRIRSVAEAAAEIGDVQVAGSTVNMIEGDED